MSPDPTTARGNPYLQLLVEGLAGCDVEVERFNLRAVLTGRGDVVHLHWPESSLSIREPRKAASRVSRMLLTLLAARLRRMPVLWTVHNLRGHERPHPRLERVFWLVLPRLVTGWFSLTEAGRAEVRRAFPVLANKPSWVTPHGHYRTAYPTAPAHDAALMTMGLTARDVVVAHVGHIRAYKNVPALIGAFRASGRATILVVAGACHPPALADAIVAAAAGDPRVVLALSRATEEKVVTILAAADLVVLPYRETFNSGSALLALSADRPVMLPRTSAYEELREEVGPGWVYLYDGEFGPESLDAALDDLRPKPGPALGPQFEWLAVSRATAGAYRLALGLD